MGGDVGRELLALAGDTEAVGVGREDDVGAVLIVVQPCGNQAAIIKPLGINDQTRNMAEDAEIGRR